MSKKSLTGGLLLLCAVCLLTAATGGVEARADGDAKTKTVKKADDKWLDSEAMVKKMKSMKLSWQTLKVASRKQDGKKAASEAEVLRKMGPDMLRYDGKAAVPDKTNKSGKVRKQKDYKEWVTKFEKGAKDFAKAAKKGDWKAAGKAQNTIRETCSDCHDSYKPPDD